MSVNPYESPRPDVEIVIRSPKAEGSPALLSVVVVPIAGLVGGSLFTALLYVVAEFHGALTLGIAATFFLLVVADGHIQQRRPAFVSGVIGMLLAAPLAWGIAFGLGLRAYGLATQELPGATLMFLLAYQSFFLTLSLGGWLAICWTRSFTVSQKQISN